MHDTVSAPTTPVEAPTSTTHRRFARVHYVALTAIMALALDAVTKHLAVALLIPDQKVPFGPLTLQLVYNAGNASNPHPAPISHVVVTHLFVLVIALGWLKLFKSKVAAVASGLCIGGMCGNFASLALPPHKVPDFIDVATKICNLADISIFCGIVLISCSLARSVLLMYREHSAAATVKP